MQKSLTKTLVFQLEIQQGSQQLLSKGQLEARRVINEIYRLNKENYNWSEIEQLILERSKHVKNTTQQLFEKAKTTLNRYYNENEYGHPTQEYQDSFPIRMNHGEGYQLENKKNNISFRITALKRNFVRGCLNGSPHNLELVENALESDDWRVGTAEVVKSQNQHELHINITHKTAEVSDKETAQTVVGVDVNEDCIGLAATSEEQIEDSVVIEYPEIKRERHEYFTIRKRMQSVGQTSLDSEVQGEEQRFVYNQLHQVSREIVNWVDQFENPVIVFEDLKNMRDDIDYGARMNRRLHSLPFAQLQNFVSYKAAWSGTPSEKIDPEYTSQECVDCGHTTRSNRQGKRFQCVQCGFQDHADRKAAMLIGARGLEKLNRNVPALNSPPVVRTMRVRRQCNGACEQPDHDPVPLVRGYQTDGGSGSVRH